MTYVPHHRFVMSGIIGPGSGIEQFSMSFAIHDDNTPGVTNYELDQTRFEDCVSDISAWFSRAGTGITDRAKLTQVKAASINSGGFTVGTVKVAAVSVPGAVNGEQSAVVGGFPFQIAQKVTFHTAADGGRVKGGFYVPCPSREGFDPTTNLWSTESVAARRDSLDTLIEALNNQPGDDNAGFVVVVASQGRKNRDGSVRIGPGNHAVDYVSVGRRPDVVRRRANRISENRHTPAEIAGE